MLFWRGESGAGGREAGRWWVCPGVRTDAVLTRGWDILHQLPDPGVGHGTFYTLAARVRVWIIVVRISL